ncbi:MAG: exodeoxyribonuclease VII large subunit [Phycisphaera sp.]|nr:MAG: exodeoxyribonuclease VII large subunit [Phycisphaera sp.]
MSGRLPFKAGELRTSSTKKTAQDAPISVSMLAGLIDGSLRKGIPSSVRVIGEVSGFRERTHWYFDLKDADAVVQCVVFASSARKLGFVPENGQEVVASGRIDFYAKGGKVSLIATKLEPVGAGALDLAYQKLLNELRELGWFAADRKRPLPVFPRKIAVLTSRSSAAYQDVLDTARRRCAAVGIVLVDVRVQGEAATLEIARAVRAVGRMHERLGVDAIILTRGGGSTEDLWCFNERAVAEAIVESPIPIVAAIGHETDTTIAELAADVRAATPTQAAMRLIPDGPALAEQVTRQANRLSHALKKSVADLRDEIAAIQSRPVFRRADELVRPARAALESHERSLTAGLRHRLSSRAIKLEKISNRLERVRPDRVASRQERENTARLARAEQRFADAMSRVLDTRQIRLTGLRRELNAVSPVAVLQRGYSVTLDSKGRAVRSIGSVSSGDTIETRLADGSIKSVVGAAGDPSRRPPSRRPKPGSDKDQMDLFDGER